MSKGHNENYTGKPKGDRHTCHVKGWRRDKIYFCDCGPEELCTEEDYVNTKNKRR